jgi:hypothetical protein
MFSTLSVLPPPAAAAARPIRPAPLRVVPAPFGPTTGAPPASPLPPWPSPQPPPTSPAWPAPTFTVLRPPAPAAASKQSPDTIPFPPIPGRPAASPPPPRATPPPPTQAPVFSAPPPAASAPSPLWNKSSPQPDFTDDDLRDALAPLVAATHGNGATTSVGAALHPLLEPLIRATVRRSLAEYSPATRPFRSPGTLDRLLWRLDALFTSRSYEEIFFEKTHRFQVDEVFAIDSETLAPISHASCDPARHASATRVADTIQRIAPTLHDENGYLRRSIQTPDGRTILTIEGDHIILVALVRGQTNDLILTDLEFALIRIEDHFAGRLTPGGEPLLRALQPFLEDCLLIQAPASAA